MDCSESVGHSNQKIKSIKRKQNRIKTEIAPEMAAKFGREVQHHLNRALADIEETLHSKTVMFDRE